MKIGLMLDEFDDRRKEIIKDIKTEFGKKATYVESTIPMSFIEQDGFDLIVLDYGGISVGIGNSLSESYARYVNEYAGNHPNTLILYVTVMGKKFLSAEGVNFDELHNIEHCDFDEIKTTFDKWNGIKHGKRKD